MRISPVVYKQVTTTCPDCGGKGFIQSGRDKGTCTRCGGTGKITADI